MKVMKARQSSLRVVKGTVRKANQVIRGTKQSVKRGLTSSVIGEDENSSQEDGGNHIPSTNWTPYIQKRKKSRGFNKSRQYSNVGRRPGQNTQVSMNVYETARNNKVATNMTVQNTYMTNGRINVSTQSGNPIPAGMDMRGCRQTASGMPMQSSGQIAPPMGVQGDRFTVTQRTTTMPQRAYTVPQGASTVTQGASTVLQGTVTATQGTATAARGTATAAGVASGAATAGATAGITAGVAVLDAAAKKAKRSQERMREFMEATMVGRSMTGEKKRKGQEPAGQADERQSLQKGSSIVVLGIPMLFVLFMFSFMILLFAGGTIDEPSGDQIIEVAKQELEDAEENIGGNKYKTWYGIDGNWCAMFVSWCANECGYIESGIMPKAASVLSMENWYEEKDLFHTKESGYVPKAGDIVIFRNGASHVGLVIEYDDETKMITTIEGNTGASSASPYHKGSRVKEKKYPLTYSTITGYGTPQYEEVDNHADPDQ